MILFSEQIMPYNFMYACVYLHMHVRMRVSINDQHVVVYYRSAYRRPVYAENSNCSLNHLLYCICAFTHRVYSK